MQTSRMYIPGGGGGRCRQESGPRARARTLPVGEDVKVLGGRGRGAPLGPGLVTVVRLARGALQGPAPLHAAVAMLLPRALQVHRVAGLRVPSARGAACARHCIAGTARRQRQRGPRKCGCCRSPCTAINSTAAAAAHKRAVGVGRTTAAQPTQPRLPTGCGGACRSVSIRTCRARCSGAPATRLSQCLCSMCAAGALPLPHPPALSATLSDCQRRVWMGCSTPPLAGVPPARVGHVRQSIASTRVEVQHRAPRPSSARHCHKNANTSTPGIKSHTRGAGRGAVRLLGARDTVPECTVRQATTTGRVPSNYSPHPTILYAPMPRFHINLTVPEAAELPAQSGSDIWLEQAIVQNMCCRPTGGCGRAHTGGGLQAWQQASAPLMSAWPCTCRICALPTFAWPSCSVLCGGWLAWLAGCGRCMRLLGRRAAGGRSA